MLLRNSAIRYLIYQEPLTICTTKENPELSEKKKEANLESEQKTRIQDLMQENEERLTSHVENLGDEEGQKEIKILELKLAFATEILLSLVPELETMAKSTIDLRLEQEAKTLGTEGQMMWKLLEL